MAAATETLRRTALYDRHAEAGARLVPFAGWEMPVQYAGIRQEHEAVRERAGVFDVSHMGEIETRGRNAAGLLQRLVSNDVRRIPEGGAQYSVLCRDDGGILDDAVPVVPYEPGTWGPEEANRIPPRGDIWHDPDPPAE